MKRLPTAVITAALALTVPFSIQAQTAATATSAQVEPIDPARLQIAERIAGQIMPDGTYAKLMSASMDGMMKPMMDMVGNMPLAQVAALGGLSDAEASQLGEGTIKELNAIIDPVFEQRMNLTTTAMLGSMTKLMSTMEPNLRVGLSRAFARRYTLEQLSELSRFFDTPTGRVYAADSMMVFADPEVMTKMMEMLPKIMEQMPDMAKEMDAQVSKLPKAREWHQLTAAEKARVAKLLGSSVDEIETRQTAAVEEHSHSED